MLLFVLCHIARSDNESIVIVRVYLHVHELMYLPTRFKVPGFLWRAMSLLVCIVYLLYLSCIVLCSFFLCIIKILIHWFLYHFCGRAKQNKSVFRHCLLINVWCKATAALKSVLEGPWIEAPHKGDGVRWIPGKGFNGPAGAWIFCLNFSPFTVHSSCRFLRCTKRLVFAIFN